MDLRVTLLKASGELQRLQALPISHLLEAEPGGAVGMQPGEEVELLTGHGATGSGAPGVKSGIGT